MYKICEKCGGKGYIVKHGLVEFIPGEVCFEINEETGEFKAYRDYTEVRIEGLLYCKCLVCNGNGIY